VYVQLIYNGTISGLEIKGGTLLNSATLVRRYLTNSKIKGGEILNSAQRKNRIFCSDTK